MTYNLTLLQEAETIYKVFVYADNASGNIMVGLFMIAIFFVFLMALKRYSFTNALLASSFVSFILSLFLTYANLLNFMFPLFFLITASLTALYSMSVE
jgi:hypothetical protein